MDVQEQLLRLYPHALYERFLRELAKGVGASLCVCLDTSQPKLRHGTLPNIFSRKLKPGAYIEYQDYGCELFLTNGTKLMEVSEEHPLATYMYHVSQASIKMGRPVVFAPYAKQHLIDAGFVDVVEKTAVWPVGDWPKDKMLKDIGRFGRQGTLDSLYPFGVHLLTKQGWTVDQVKELCDKVAKSFAKANQKGDIGKYYFQG